MTADKPTAVALVTGGAQGLGRGIAEELALAQLAGDHRGHAAGQSSRRCRFYR